MTLATLLKQPGELLIQPMTFNGVTTIQALLGCVVTPRGLVNATTPLVVVPALLAGGLTLNISGGSDGEQYLVTVQVEDAVGQEVESELEILVIDQTWVMPDGGAPYLTIADFVARFGLSEAVRMTDSQGDGRIDRALLVATLTDAQAIVDAHLAARYTVPLTDVPHVVKTLVADLARSRLYPGGMPDGVEAAAKAATRMLERIQAGGLPIPAATAPVEAVSDNPVLISPGTRHYRDGLTGY